jgi:hypothetical protein
MAAKKKGVERVKDGTADLKAKEKEKLQKNGDGRDFMYGRAYFLWAWLPPQP